ncbi:MAG TPA: Mut7-C RNAse domain-containing protein [Hanamia sp.]|nr:Mut7-C RNAse domain-containing protein [Hanamia sp.]
MKFIADVHLGKLAKLLRMLGFDVVYNHSLSNKELLLNAMNESRILLSKNNAFKNNKSIQCFILTSENPEIQLQEALIHFNLKEKINPFTKCMVCNGGLHAVTKDAIANQLQANTKHYFNEFWQCDNCKRIYWKGSHYERMMKFIEKLQ